MRVSSGQSPGRAWETFPMPPSPLKVMVTVPSFVPMSVTRIKIAKLDPATDAAHIEKALEAVPKVRAVTMHPAEHQAIVEHDGADVEQLTSAVKQLGYVSLVE